MLRTVAIYSKDNNSKTREGVNRLVKEFCRRGIKIQIYQKSVDIDSCPEGSIIERFSRSVEISRNCLIWS